jgi:hypothetical protein
LGGHFSARNKISGGIYMRKYQAQTYSIGNVAKMTGATKKQIRNWEASGHIPKADRIHYGDRAYQGSIQKQKKDNGGTLPTCWGKIFSVSCNAAPYCFCS